MGKTWVGIITHIPQNLQGVVRSDVTQNPDSEARSCEGIQTYKFYDHTGSNAGLCQRAQMHYTALQLEEATIPNPLNSQLSGSTSVLAVIYSSR